MSKAAQLARIAAARPDYAVKIRKMRKNIDAYFWLCDLHVSAKEADGWEVIEDLEPPHKLKCEEC